MIDGFENMYHEYEKTGDPTMLIITIVVGIIIGGIWLLRTMDN